MERSNSAAATIRFIIALHMLWLAALWWWAPGRPIDIPLLALFALLQLGRVWVISTLGERWTTRIIVMPGAPLVRKGPYRFVDHPNYLIVIAGDRSPAVGVRTVANCAALQPVERGHSGYPHPRGEQGSGQLARLAVHAYIALLSSTSSDA